MRLLRSSWEILRPHWRRYLALNLLVYGGIVIGFGLGMVSYGGGSLPGWGSFSPTSGRNPGILGLEWLIWLARHRLVLAGCFLVINLTLVNLAILAGATWPPLLVLLGGWFALELAGVTAIYVALQPWALAPVLPLLVLEGQAVILGLFIGWGLGARKADWRQRVRAWGAYRPVYLLIPALLVAAGLWEAWIIAALVEAAVG
jgi:hypothetical protein